MTVVGLPRNLPTSSADPFSYESLEEPGELQAELRDAGPVVYLTRYCVYGLARYEEVHDAAVNWQSFQSGAGVGLANFRTEKPWRTPSLLLETDPPRHDAPRAVLSKILGQPQLRSLREGWFADAEELVDEVLRDREFDAAQRLAAAFPLRVFPDAVGLPREGRENLLPYGDHNFNVFGPHNDLVTMGLPGAPKLSAWVDAHCQRPILAETGFGAQIWAAADRGDITHSQAPLIVRSLLSAGVDTTVHGLAAVLYAFATHPEEWQRLRGDPSLVRLAFDEAVRWESPVQTFFRTATCDIEVASTVVPRGEKILMFLGAANRDPRRWTNPDRFDLTRDPSGHVGFGMGLHQCVGQHIARLEAEALLTALVKRVERIDIVGPTKRHHNNTLRGWDSLPVRVELTRTPSGV